ncbi:hypothetical protein LX32DRAFT_722789 [Colletotrichum zoysiae]|uniref:Uncharacterized protein n=1 Tax=Colletotrichum zoysiae TaxID=1216348 RepID=A0AAD9LYH0_9PEZI|nr:hypothetical protein LX32DRAFT_722789 [Colletotrichum zoysiae]
MVSTLAKDKCLRCRSAKPITSSQRVRLEYRFILIVQVHLYCYLYPQALKETGRNMCCGVNDTFAVKLDRGLSPRQSHHDHDCGVRAAM